MKIWIVTLDWTDLCDSNVVVKPFRDKDKAIARFNDMVADYRVRAEEDGWTVEDDTPSYFGAFEDGYERQSHTYITLEEHEI